MFSSSLYPACFTLQLGFFRLAAVQKHNPSRRSADAGQAAITSATLPPMSLETTSMAQIFHYIGGLQYPGTQPQHKERITWAGDINEKVVSIRIDKTSPEVYTCVVLNPPDMSSPKQIKLRVVEKDPNRKKEERK
ncbi:myelin protein zero-like protein 1 isoform X5 [Dendropsophus ebraccatus]|uniref:myelin protein zero-like protein 1 isoform X5 n=1 Tax=Dendropsophus ebraccatus TaxID=150705 RepID=UPI0038313D28